MSQSQQLLPSLFALLPPSLHQRIIAHLSLQSLHVEPYSITDDIYLPTNPVVPQYRTLRLRTTTTTTTTGRDGLGITQDATHENKRRRGAKKEGHELSYVSNTLNGREYADVNVRAVLGVDIAGESERGDIEDFIEGLGFRHSHSYTRTGLLFHLPTPLVNLHLSITRLSASSASPTTTTKSITQTSEPYLVQLEAGTPIPAIPTRAEPGIQDVIGVMLDVADRIDGLEWGTGR